MENKRFIKRSILAMLLITAALLYEYIPNRHNGLDLLQDLDWSHLPGAEVSHDGVYFQPLNRMITHQDGSIGQLNPPVNLSGPHLKVSGDFSITATFVGIDEQAFLRLYTGPPIIYDQWRLETPSIEIAVGGKMITQRIWDGSSSNSIDMRTYTSDVPTRTTISLERRNDQIGIRQNGRWLGGMPDHHIFDSHNVWFGADATPGSASWTLAGLTAHAVGTGSVEVVPVPSLIVDQNDPNSLRNLSKNNARRLPIGAAVAVGPLLTDDQYRKLALGQFSILTPENELKPQFIHPQPNIYLFKEADVLVDAARENNMIVHGHTLIYDKSTPDWMIKTPKPQRQTVMLEHIKQVVEHFKGRVAQWDVVNEPFSQKNALYKNGGTGLQPNIWFEAMGEEYIDLAFKAAYAADPAAKLYLNDYGLEQDGQHWDAFLALIKRLKKRGVSIHGVGFEAHIYTDGDYINPPQLEKHMEVLRGLGLSTRISEIDVTGDDPKEQVSQYVTALDICLRQPNCTSYTTWGITDRYGSTTRSDRYPPVYGTSLLWDNNFKPKPAYNALQERLKKTY